MHSPDPTRHTQILRHVLQDPHDSCTNNLHTSLRNIGWKLTDDPDTYLTPGPFNLCASPQLCKSACLAGC